MQKNKAATAISPSKHFQLFPCERIYLKIKKENFPCKTKKFRQQVAQSEPSVAGMHCLQDYFHSLSGNYLSAQNTGITFSRELHSFET